MTVNQNAAFAHSDNINTAPDETQAAVRQRTSWQTTEAKLELTVDVRENKSKVLNWIAKNNMSHTMTSHAAN